MRSSGLPAKGQEWGIATECVPEPNWKRRPTSWWDELRTFSPLAQRTARNFLNDTE